MTKKQILKALGIYEKCLVKIGAENKEARHDGHPDKKEALDNTLFEVFEVRGFLKRGVKRNKEKAMRWLGNIQEFLWLNGNFTLNELRNHNKPIREKSVLKRKKNNDARKRAIAVDPNSVIMLSHGLYLKGGGPTGTP